MKRRNQDMPGNAMESQAQYQRQMVRLAEQLVRAERTFDNLFDEDVVVLRMTIRLPQYEGQEYMVIVGARSPEGRVVTFHSSETFAEAVRGALARLENRSNKWREDKYASED